MDMSYEYEWVTFLFKYEDIDRIETIRHNHNLMFFSIKEKMFELLIFKLSNRIEVLVFFLMKSLTYKQ